MVPFVNSIADHTATMTGKRKRILHIVTNTGHYGDQSHPTGLWLSELAHAWDVFSHHGYEQSIASPAGGRCPLDPRSLHFPSTDKSARAWHADPVRMDLLENTASPEQIDSEDFDGVFLTGGHGAMYDFPGSEGLQRITREVFEQEEGVVGSVCHGYCGLLNTKLSDGSYLVSGRQMTGLSWTEEVLARVNRLVPYNAEEEVKKRGAHYKKTTLPFTCFTLIDGNLVTGQNPESAKETARNVVAAFDLL